MRLIGEQVPESSRGFLANPEHSPEDSPGNLGSSAYPIVGERKSITILFTDIVGSTPLAENLDPEDWKNVVAGAHHTVGECVQRYGGYIAQLLGDGVLAFFGAPTTHEDDPIRAVRAALDIQTAIQIYAQELRQIGRVIDFQMRIGINSGPVVVDLVGSQSHFEYSAFGDAVNLAARLQSAANPGKILLSENTYRSVQHAFACLDLGEIEVKGKSQPIHVYELKQIKSQQQMHRPVNLESAMVGREEQLGTLLENSRLVVNERKGRVVIILGEPGMGKSRLVAEWRKTMLDNGRIGENWNWAEGYCLSYTQTTAYYLVRSLGRSVLNLPEGFSPADIRAALPAAMLGDQTVPKQETLFYLYKLLEPDQAEDPTPLHAQSLQAQFYAALRSLLGALSERQPLALVLEDIHWADPSSVDLLNRLLPLVISLPIIVCLVARPSRQAIGWKLIESSHNLPADRVTQLTISALSTLDSQKLMNSLLSLNSLPSEIGDLILKKSEGTPFFIEEVLNLLIDRGDILKEKNGWSITHDIHDIEIPNSMQRLLLARVDRLAENLKLALRVASVVGRRFNFDVLFAVLHRLQDQLDRDQLSSELFELEGSGLIKESEFASSLEFIFRHALIQEAVYSAILRNDRRSLHRAVARAIEQIFSGHTNELASTIAYHHERGEEWEPAVRWLTRAGKLAAEEWALPEALDFDRRALAALAHGPRRRPLEFSLHSHLANSMTLMGMPRDETMEEYNLCLSLSSNDCEAAQIHFHKGQLLHIYTSSDLVEAEAEYNQALDLVKRDESDPLYCNILSFLGYLYRYQYRIPLSIKTLHHALDLAVRLDSIDLKADINIFLSGAYLEAGREDEAISACLEGLSLAKQIGNLELIGRAHSFSTEAYLTRAFSGRGREEEALPHIKEMIRFGKEYNTAILAGFGAEGMAQYKMFKGDLPAALTYWREGAQVWLQVHAPTRAASAHSKCGQVQLQLGEIEEALNSFEMVKQDFGDGKENSANFFIGLAYGGAGFETQACSSLQLAFETADSVEQRRNWIKMIRTRAELSELRKLPGVTQLLDRYERVG